MRRALLGLALLCACRGEPRRVVVVGGGPAGLAAAWQAAQDGAAVQLFEALETVGGSAIWSDAITATPTAADLARWEATAGGPNPALRRYADRVVPDVIEALGACGVEFETTMNPLNDGLALVRPIKGGRGLVADLDRCTRSAGAAITTGAKVTGLSAAPEGGFVVQVGEVEHRADAVILATGGFMADLDHVRAVLKLGADAPLLRGAPDHADGNGILLGTALGGVEERPGAVLLYAHGTPAPGEPERALMVVDPRRGLIVTTEGEALPLLQGMRGDLGKDLAALPGGAAWLVVDALAFDRMPFFDYRRGGKIPPVALRSLGVEAPTLPALAEALKIPPDALLAAQSPDRPSPEKPIGAKGPFRALPLYPTTAKSLTGLVVDLDGRVLNAAGAPVPGLFAAGELTGFGDAYDGHPVDSTMVAGAILTGRAAGKQAASR